MPGFSLLLAVSTIPLAAPSDQTSKPHRQPEGQGMDFAVLDGDCSTDVLILQNTAQSFSEVGYNVIGAGRLRTDFGVSTTIAMIQGQMHIEAIGRERPARSEHCPSRTSLKFLFRV